MKRTLLLGLVLLLGAWSVASAQDVRWDPYFATDSLNGPVYTMLVRGTDVYVGGSFTMAGSVTANRVAKWNGTSWSAVGSGTSGTVWALAWYDDTLWVGGTFASAGGKAATNLAKCDGTNYFAVGGAVGSGVYSLLVTANGLYVGGAFGEIGNISPVYNIARYKAGAWSDLGGGVRDGWVENMTQLPGDTLVVGGYFTILGRDSVSSNSVAKLYDTTWYALPGITSGDLVNSVVTVNDTLYVGGSFFNVNGGAVLARRIARNVRGAWSTLSDGFDERVRTIHYNPLNGMLYAGGDFQNSGSNPMSRISEWNGTSWNSLGSGTNGSVRVIRTVGKNVYAGGLFGTAGTRVSPYFAIYRDAPTLVSPADLASVTVTPTLDWNDVTGADSYHLQIASDAAFTSIVSNQTGLTLSTYVVPGAVLSANTVYYWRVASVDGGEESNWSEARSFTTSIVAPTLSFPADLAAVSVTPSLDWNTITGATSYRVQISTSSDFATTVLNQTGITTSAFDVPGSTLAASTTYYWRVAASNLYGDSPWSTSRSMTTSIIPPTLASPGNDATVSSTPALDWNDITGATAYRLQISANSSFSTTVLDLGTIATSNYTVTAGVLVDNTEYYWRVAAISASDTSAYSASRNFTTSIIAPTLSAPANAAAVNVTPTLDWGDVTGATSYRVQVATDAGFTTVVLDRPALATSTYVVLGGELNGTTTYHWRAAAANTYGQGPWSAARTFTTSIVAPTLVTPADAASVTIIPTLDWSDITGATSYRLQISTNSGFTTTILDQGSILTSTYTVGAGTLAENTLYYWRVLATNAYGDSPYSTSRSFTTSIVAPTLVSPTTGAAVTVTPTLDWNDVTGVTGYHVQVSTSPTFTSTVVNATGVLTSTYTVASGVLAENTEYYWRVAATSAYGDSPYSTSRTFTTSIVAPTLVSPVNAAAVTLTPVLDWNDVTGATSYRLQISTSSTFATTVVDQSGLATSTYTVGSGTLSATTQYYWRVLATSSYGDSPYSASRTFTTSIVAPTLASPADAAAVTVTPALDWNDIAGATSYRLQVSTVSNFATTVLDQTGIVTSTYTVGSGVLNANTQYYWRVLASSAYGDSPYSTSRTFTTSIIAPTLVSPANAAAVTIIPALDWSDITGATSYHLQISTSSTFTSTALDQGGIATSDYTVEAGILAENTLYYWRVAASNTYGDGPWSANRTFTTSIVAPTLASPPNAAAVNVTPTLDWNDVTGVTGYHLQISTSSSFATTIVDASGLAASTYTVASATLSDNTQYYWRVAATSAYGDSPWSASRSFTTSIIAPTLTSPPDAAAVTLTPTLDWSDITGATAYRLQVSTSPAFTTTILDQSSIVTSTFTVGSGTLSASTQYYWRVLASNAYGASPYSSVRSFTTTIVAPTLNTPPNAAAVTVTPVLDWNDITGATGYHLQISTSESFSSTVIDVSGLVPSTYTVGAGALAENTQYYWRVAAANAYGESPYSTSRTFTTSIVAPTLASPPNAAAVTVTPNLDWNDVTGAASYRLQISTSSTFTTTVLDQSGIGPSTFTVSSGTLTAATQYYWRVLATSNYGDSPWSSSRSFTTSVVAPTLVSPADAAAVTVVPTLDWNDVTGATAYRLQISTSSTFSTTVVDQGSIGTSTYAVPSGTLAEGTQYYWRVAASNAYGESPFSPSRSFTTSIVAPTLVSPDNAAAVTVTPTLDWNDVSGGTGYHLQVSTSSTFSSTVLDQTGITSSTYTVASGALSTNTQYYWRVATTSTYGESPWAASRSFTTSIVAPTLVSPANASAVTVTPTLDWSDVAGTSGYRLQISTSSTFTTTVLDQSGIATSTFTVASGTLTASTQYYWRVLAGSSYGDSPWSASRSFTTSIVAPTLVSPPDAAAVTATPTLDWNDVTGATSYRLQISTSSAFTTTVLDQSGLATSTLAVSSGTLANNTLYYWRVLATNANGDSPWSTSRSFTTSILAPSLISPPVGAAVTTTPTLSWSTVTGATSYNVQVSTSSTFSTTVVNQTGLTSATYTVGAGVLSENTQYYWRAAAVNAQGQGPWSAGQDFTTSMVAPSLVSPPAASAVTTTPTLDWSDVTGATSYRVQISTSSTFSTTVLDSSHPGSSALTVPAARLTQDTEYYWRVAAVNAVVQGPWSASRTFTTSVVAPAPIAPLAGSAVTPTPTLDWSDVTGSTSYRLQISTSSTFSTTVVDQSGIVSSTQTIAAGILTDNTHYYWRVAAVNAQGQGPWSTTFDFTTSIVAPTLVAPPTAAAVTVTPALDWSDITGATSYRVQISTAASFATTVLDSSGLSSSAMTVGSGTLAASTQYYWRVAAANVNGQGPWSASRNFTTSIVAPALLSPPAAAAVTVTPTLDWNDITGATSYRLQISTSSTFSTTVVDQSGLATSIVTVSSGSLLDNTQYYWRVAAVNANGQGPWSTSRDFTTSIVAPTLVAPPTAAAVTATPTLDWSDITGATSYRLQISVSSTFATTVLDQSGLASSTLTVAGGTLNENTQYYWRVAAVNTQGQGPWSTSRNFTTSIVAPTLVSPLAASAVTTTPTLDWGDVTGATSYHVQISTTSSFSSTELDTTGVLGSTISVPFGILAQNTQYYWRVAASNVNGTGPWSTSWDFTTSVVAPALIAPPAAAAVTVTPTLDWNEVTGALSYRVQISTASNFATTVLDTANLTASAMDVPSGRLADNTQYYWRVAAVNGSGQGPWSSSRDFTTSIVAPTLVSPPAAAAVTVTPTLDWADIAGATAYRVQVSISSTFTTTVLDQGSLSTSTLTVPGGVLTQNTTYYWRVRASNANGTGPWSAGRNFTTSIIAPTLVSPPAAAAVSTTPALDWSDVTGATSYRVQVSTTSAFSTTAFDTAGVSASSLVVPYGNLGEDTQYYWRVAASNDNGTGPWSASRDFVTSLVAPGLVSPPAAAAVTVTPTLDWSTVSVATSYRLQISTDADFATTALDSGGLSASILTVPAGRLSGTTEYYWRVAGVNSVGQGTWSETRDFLTSLVQPTLVTPAAGAVNVATSPQIVWRKITGATTYRLQVATDPGFASGIALDDSTLTDTVKTVSGLSTLTTYYWRVRASSDYGTGPYSASRQFTTVPALPAQVALVSPVGLSEIMSDTVRFVWRKSTPLIQNYWLEYSGDSTFATGTIDSSLTDSTKAVTGLLANTTYYWRVKAKNAAGWGPFSVRGAFKKIINSIADAEVPLEFDLSQNYPNPFNPTTTIDFAIPKTTQVSLKIYNNVGEEVETLVSEEKTPGRYSVQWNGRGAASGVYYYRIVAGDFVVTKKLVLLK